MPQLTAGDYIAFAGIVLVAVGMAAAVGRVYVNWKVSEVVDQRLTPAVRVERQLLQAQMQGHDEKLDVMRLNQEEISVTLGKVHTLEATISNGLTEQIKGVLDELAYLRSRLDALTDHLLDT